MRIISFQVKWPKLKQPRFTTFRYSRRDRDWEEGEMVKIVIRARSKDREFMGCALIANKEPIHPGDITDTMAQADGFDSAQSMRLWLERTYKNDIRWRTGQPLNKLTIMWGINHKPGGQAGALRLPMGISRLTQLIPTGRRRHGANFGRHGPGRQDLLYIGATRPALPGARK